MISSPEKSKNQNKRKYIGKHTFNNVLVQYVVVLTILLSSKICKFWIFPNKEVQNNILQKKFLVKKKKDKIIYENLNDDEDLDKIHQFTGISM